MRPAGHFDRIAASYDGSLPRHVVRHYLQKRTGFLKALYGSGRVLDVGCGTGLLAAALRRRGVMVVGVDGSEGMLRIMRQFGRGPAVLANAALLPFADGQFDGAYCVALVHHLGASAPLRGVLFEVVRVTRPGGWIVVWDANPCNPYWRVVMRRVPQDIGVERLVPAAEIAGCLRAAGADAIRVYHSGFIPDFAPRALMPLFLILERVVEAVPLLRGVAAHNVIVGRKA